MRSRIIGVLVTVAAGCGDGGATGPHATGAITIAEAHAASGGVSTTAVTIAFAPDASAPGVPAACTREVAGCAVTLEPDCGDACGADERCSFDAGCAAICARRCDLACGPDAACVLAPTGEPTCRVPARFDAGAITIAGDAGQLTLPPPYAYPPTEDDPLFADRDQLSISALGANLAGYAAFSEPLDATVRVRTEPPLVQLGAAAVFGTGDLPVGWVAGADDLTITATVVDLGGRAVALACPARDGDGHLAVPRAAIDAALAGGELDRLVLAVHRRKARTVRGLATVGTLDDQVVQPTGWLELATVSTETAAFQGCPDGQSRCDGVCVDLAADPDHCGACDLACPSGDGCFASTCAGQTSCDACAATVSTSGAACAEADAQCEADAACAALRTCLAGCTGTACSQQCATNHQAGLAGWGAWMECVCGTECAAPCAGRC